jgi:hypothetical protein
VQSHKLVLSHSNASVSSFWYGKATFGSSPHNPHIQKQDEDISHMERKVNNQYLANFLIIL